jgi:hypothetical protein
MAVVAQAQDRLQPTAAGASVKTTRLSAIMKSKILIQDDQSAGTVTDVVLSDSGCVDYVVASYEDQYYVIPYSAVNYRAADQVVFVDIAPAQFRRVQFFTGNNWPDFYASNYQQTVFSVFGVNNVRRDGPRSTLKPNLDRDGDRDGNRNREGDRNRDADRNRDGERNRDRDADRNRDRDSNTPAKDRNKDDADNQDRPAKPNPGLSDPPKPNSEVKPPNQPATSKPDIPKAEAPKADAPKAEAPKAERPKAELPKPLQKKPIAPQAPVPAKP